MIRVEPFEGPNAEWDAFVRTRPQWTHFHLHGWRDVIAQVFGHECVYLAARGATDRLEGVLPLVHVHSLLFGRYLVSMPFVNYGGPLGSDAAVRALVARAVEEARTRNVRMLELRSRWPLPIQMEASHRKITAVLQIPDGDAEKLWRALDAKVRSQVRRPMKEGVTVRFGLNQLSPFYDVFARHMRDLGTPTQPRELFEAIAARFGNDVWFGCAYVGDRPVAGGCGFRWQEEFELTWASALSEFKRIAPNMLLYWAFMERAVQTGVRAFNFGRCTPESGTHRFKRQWRTVDEQLWWYGQADSPGVITPSPTQQGLAWGPRLWKHLPLRLATSLGPRIVRGIP